MNTEALSTLRQMPETKREQEAFSSLILNSVLDGDIPALEVDILLKSIEEAIKLVRKNEEFKEALKDELELYVEKTVDLRNCTITKSSRGAIQFKEDSEIISIEAKLNARKELIKIACKSKAIITDPETGEEIKPVSVFTTEYQTIKFK